MCLVGYCKVTSEKSAFPFVQGFNCQPQINVVSLALEQLGQLQSTTNYKESSDDKQLLLWASSTS